LERRRAVYETCPECRRLADFSRLRTTALASGLDAPPAALVASVEAQLAALTSKEKTAP